MDAVAVKQASLFLRHELRWIVSKPDPPYGKRERPRSRDSSVPRQRDPQTVLGVSSVVLDDLREDLAFRWPTDFALDHILLQLLALAANGDHEVRAWPEPSSEDQNPADEIVGPFAVGRPTAEERGHEKPNGEKDESCDARYGSSPASSRSIWRVSRHVRLLGATRRHH